MKPELRLQQLGLALPVPPPPAGSYDATVIAGDLLFIAGQFSFSADHRFTGAVGRDLSLAEGRAAAQLAALNVLARINVALGGFDRLVQLVRVEGHVASAPGFLEIPKVLDGASELFLAVLGDRGKHTRTAFSPDRLPLNLTVELVVTAAIRAG